MKLVHLTGVVLFLGNISVGVFWKRHADRTRSMAIMASTMDAIVAADKIFTIPGIVILLAGGFGTAVVGQIPILATGWLLWGLGAFILSGVAFVPLSRIQRRISVAAHAGNAEQYEELSRGWDFWGAIALLLPIAAFVLMILKPNLPAFHHGRSPF